MPRYDQIWAALAQRAVDEGGIDIRTFLKRAYAAGMSAQAVEARLLADLEEGGPIFGKFLRSLSGAATAAVSAAERAGDYAGYVDGDAELRRLTGIANMDDALEDGDPEMLAAIEEATAGKAQLTWICTLVRTCYRCLPLHGQTRTLDEWLDLGLHPDTIHDGWTSECQCQLVPAEQAASSADLRTPLFREKIKTDAGVSVSRKTQRVVGQADIEKATAAAAQAMKTPEGRRALQAMGQLNAQGAENG